MKHLVALVVLFFAISAYADEAPAVSLHQALEIAEKSMNDRGLNKEIFIESVTLNRSAVFGGETYWLVKWSHPLVGDSGKREIGIKVRMDGSATRLVKSLVGK